MTDEHEWLRSSDVPLAEIYDVALLDLDGVVYVGPDAVPGAPSALQQCRERGMRLAFVTNNAARTPQAVAAQLSRLGIRAVSGEVVTSAQAAAHYLADRLPAAAPVLVVGTTGLIEALRERGLVPVDSADAKPVAVVQGYSPDLDWSLLAEGCVAINRGVPWVATNLDATIPSTRGPVPGNGSLVAALRHATGRAPVSTGKPDPTMHRETVERSGARRPLVIGDRLDTDIEGASRAGCPSLLVLSGVTSPRDLLDARPDLRPTYLGADVTALLEPHPYVQVAPDGSTARCGAWQVRPTDGGVSLSAGASSAPPGSAIDALRALCAMAWQARDGRHERVEQVSAVDDEGRRALRELGWR